MAKKLKTAKEIRDEINRRLAEGRELDGDCRECRVLTPRQADPADYGRNWHVEHVSQFSPGCEGVISSIVGAVGREYDCSDW